MIKLPKKKYTPKQDVRNRLVAAAPTELKQSVYEYSFTPVNLKDINAFALPGGPMFVQRGMFDAAAEEAEVAGVMAHELSRVLLRHGTANASKPQSPWLQLGQIDGAVGNYVLLFHDTHHRSVSDAEAMAQYDLDAYDGVLAFGEVIRDRYVSLGWGAPGLDMARSRRHTSLHAARGRFPATRPGLDRQLGRRRAKRRNPVVLDQARSPAAAPS